MDTFLVDDTGGRYWWTILVYEKEMCVPVSAPFVFIGMEFLSIY